MAATSHNSFDAGELRRSLDVLRTALEKAIASIPCDTPTTAEAQTQGQAAEAGDADRPWGSVDRQQDQRPHYRLILRQYERFPDDFSDEMWKVLYLKYRDGMNEQQIAQLSHRALGSVYRLLAKAKQRKTTLLKAFQERQWRATTSRRESE